MKHDKKNIMVVLSSPSGVGKTTITKKIQQKYNSFKLSVSHTTRTPRSNEVDGVDYHFISSEKFKELIKKNEFYEYAKIFDNYYGTLIFLIPDSKEELKKRLINRNQNTSGEIKRRFDSYEEDVKHWNDYDYIIINKNLENCFKQIENIISLEKDKVFTFSQTIQ